MTARLKENPRQKECIKYNLIILSCHSENYLQLPILVDYNNIYEKLNQMTKLCSHAIIRSKTYFPNGLVLVRYNDVLDFLMTEIALQTQTSFNHSHMWQRPPHMFHLPLTLQTFTQGQSGLQYPARGYFDMQTFR